MKIGLVLGAGGIQGGAWLTGGLDALARRPAGTRRSADYVVGTSAGSMIGALCASGIPPWFMVAHSRGEVFDGVVDAEGAPPPMPTAPPARASSSSGPGRRSAPARGGWRFAPWSSPAATRPPPSQRLAAARLLLHRVLRDTIRASSRAAGARTQPLDRRLRLRHRAPGAVRPRGRPATPTSPTRSRPRARSPASITRSTIGGRRYVDGGIYSTSNVDILRDEALDLVICLNPTSTLHPLRALNPRDGSISSSNAPRPAPRERGEAASRRGQRGRADPAPGRRPQGDGSQPDGRGNRNQVIEVARRTVARNWRSRAIASSSPPSPKAERRWSTVPTVRPRSGRP